MLAQLVLVGGALAVAALIGLAVLSGPSAAKASARRLQAVRFRHSDSTNARMEAQYRKAVDARKPRTPQVAGSGGRSEALALRLHRTGQAWTIQQYLYVSGGLVVVVALLAYLNTGAGLLAIGLGLLVGAGLPHMIVSRFIARRGADFTARFPDAIDLLVRGLRSGLPVSETLGVV
ncbi:MAG: pilus assembly protein TadB, partial [Novosphingobium sp.]